MASSEWKNIPVNPPTVQTISHEYYSRKIPYGTPEQNTFEKTASDRLVAGDKAVRAAQAAQAGRGRSRSRRHKHKQTRRNKSHKRR